MKIPKKVQIAGVTYRVKQKKNPVFDGLECAGYFYPQDSEIMIDTKQSEQMKGLALTHEILHAIFLHYNIPIAEEQEEDVVTALAHGVYQALEDNQKALFGRDKET